REVGSRVQSAIMGAVFGAASSTHVATAFALFLPLLPTCLSPYSPFSPHMQAAFHLVPALPAPGSRVVPWPDGPRAGPAADARIVAVVQFVVGQLVAADVLPDFFLAP